jgi:hypothetical protein
MKNIICLVILGINFGGCVSEESKIYNYTISNNSGYTIAIVGYDTNSVKDLAKKITLENGKKISNRKKVDYPAPNPLKMSEVISKDGRIEYSKIEIIFNNSKKTIFSNCKFTETGIENCDEPRNIFRPEYNDQQTEVYTITPEDYQNATDCGGDCN